ncbi:helix-turn-helix domain-containing protein [Sinorhizobium meliloti]
MSDRWLSIAEIAEHIGVSRDTVYRWIDEKGMPAHRVGRLWKFKADEVDEWVRSGKASEEEKTRPSPNRPVRGRREKN